MQDIQNIPPPDDSSTKRDDDFGSHSDIPVDLDNEGDDNEPIPVPPDQQPAVPVEEPPETQQPPVGEDWDEPKKIA